MTQAYNLAILANAVDTSGKLNIATNSSGTLPVANGGTGQTTYTNGQLLIGNTTGNTLTKATLTAGSGISVTNGAGSITIATTGGGSSPQFSIATRDTAYNSTGTPLVKNSAGNFTWTCPSGVTRVMLTVIGGGSAINSYGGYNGAGGLGQGIYTVTPGTAYSVLVGAGVAGFHGTSPVSAGGTSSFGALLSATGGAGGNGGGSNGSAANGNMLNSNARYHQPFGGVGSYGGPLGGRGGVINWEINSSVSDNNDWPAPGCCNSGDGYSASGVVQIQWIG